MARGAEPVTDKFFIRLVQVWISLDGNVCPGFHALDSAVRVQVHLSRHNHAGWSIGSLAYTAMVFRILMDRVAHDYKVRLQYHIFGYTSIVGSIVCSCFLNVASG